jgi:hypothetical protein
MLINAYFVKQDLYLLEVIVLTESARMELFIMEKIVKNVLKIVKDVMSLDALSVQMEWVMKMEIVLSVSPLHVDYVREIASIAKKMFVSSVWMAVSCLQLVFVLEKSALSDVLPWVLMVSASNVIKDISY